VEPDRRADRYMSRPSRIDFGLPIAEKAITAQLCEHFVSTARIVRSSSARTSAYVERFSSTTNLLGFMRLSEVIVE